MSLIQGISGAFGVQPATRSSGANAYQAVDTGAQIDFRRARTQLLKLYEQLETLAELSGVRSRFRLDLPDAVSSAGLGLDLTHTAATLNSTEEINASPYSFAPFGPNWSGSSSALITLGGEYDASQGTNTLTFEARDNGTRGQKNLRIRIEDLQGNRVNVTVNKNHPLDQQYDLGNGLYFTLGAGDLVKNETAAVQLYDTVGAAVDPSKAFNGVRNDNPNLQYGGPTIQNGSFTVNGETISVAASDSINDIVSRINQSTAGVTASFNAGTETLDFLQNTKGSVPTIALAGDTSNLLAALKLDTAVVTPGIDPENEKAFDTVGSFSSVSTGSFFVNDTEIAVNAAADSLDDVIERINQSGADVSASFDANTQKVTIVANDSADKLELDSNGTGLFAALNIPEGRVDAEVRSGGIARRRSYQIADAAEAAFEAMNYLFRDASFLKKDAYAGQIRGVFELALSKSFAETGADGIFGLHRDDSGSARDRGEFLSVDRRRFTQQLQQRGAQVQNVLAHKNGETGLVRDLLGATKGAIEFVNRALGISGAFIDTYA